MIITYWYQVRFPDLQGLRLRYRVIQLDRLDWRQYLGQANPVAALEQVQRLSLEQLEALSEALLDFISVADLREWLTAHHP